MSSDPAVASDSHLADIHREVVRRNSTAEGVIGVRDIDTGAEHVAVADFNVTTSIDHQISIKIVAIPNTNSYLFAWSIFRPEPAALSKGVIVADLYLT